MIVAGAFGWTPREIGELTPEELTEWAESGKALLKARHG